MSNKKIAIIVIIFTVVFMFISLLIGLAGKIPFISKPLVFIFAIILIIFVIGFFTVIERRKR